jgi:hypothetical protein
VAAVVALGKGVEWWGGGRFEAVVSNHRYLPGRRWGYVFPLLLLALFVTGPVEAGLDGWLKLSAYAGVIVLWAGRTRYERIAVDEHGGVSVAGAGLIGAAAGMTLVVGLAGAIAGSTHFSGVISAAMAKGYAYDTRLAGLLILGIGMVFAGVLCLTAVRGVAHGQRRAWDRAVIGSLLLLLVTLPITPHPTQGGMAGFLAFFAAVDLILLVAMSLIPLVARRRRLGAG